MVRRWYALLPMLAGCYAMGMPTNRFIATNGGAALVEVVFVNEHCGDASIWLDDEWKWRDRKDVKPRQIFPRGTWGRRLTLKLPTGPHTLVAVLLTRQWTPAGEQITRNQVTGAFRARPGAVVDICNYR